MAASGQLYSASALRATACACATDLLATVCTIAMLACDSRQLYSASASLLLALLLLLVLATTICAFVLVKHSFVRASGAAAIKLQ